MEKDKIIRLRADAETMEALDQVMAHESQKRLTNITASECVRYLIKKEAVSLSTDNKKT